MPTSAKHAVRLPDEQVGYLLKRLMHQMRHQVEERLRRGCDMSLAHLVTLDQLQQQPGIAGARLARRLLVTAQTMTGLLRRLEQEGSVVRFGHRGPGDAQEGCRPVSPGSVHAACHPHETQLIRWGARVLR